ncbi:hypothetical protein LTR41_003990 [Exophiala xenobiotica]|nr:hypothetical protein LTR41_003990 [Exophiala xenobiotica]
MVSLLLPSQSSSPRIRAIRLQYSRSEVNGLKDAKSREIKTAQSTSGLPVTATKDKDHCKCTFLELFAPLTFLRRPVSQDEQQTTGVDTPRLVREPISGTAESGIDSWPNNVNQSITHDGSSLQQSRPPVAGPDQQQDATLAPSTTDENSCTPSTITSRKAASDVMDTNLHTSNLEFYGSSSSVAFIRHLETLSNRQTTGPADEQPERSLASLLHNTEFQPDTSQSTPATREAAPNPERFQFRVARRFLDAYFSNIHHIQPLFEEDDFLARCEDLWFNRPAKQPLSFIALYYATLSLGSLVMTFEDPKLFGADRFTWSRKLFNEASAILTRLGTATDVEMVQCFYMMVSRSRNRTGAEH